ADSGRVSFDHSLPERAGGSRGDRILQESVRRQRRHAHGDEAKTRSEEQGMKYMLLIYMSENAMSEAEREQCYKDSTELAIDLQANGHYVSANPLQPVATATTVKIRENKRLVTDGPFA